MSLAELRNLLPKLHEVFQQVNQEHFDGFLEVPILRWNTRLRSSAGRFIPGVRPGPRNLWYAGTGYARPAAIEVASYLLEERESEKHLRDTIAHEMIHYWLWVRRRPYGHTPEFWSKMTVMGVSRYNPVPRVRPPKHLYRCPHCGQDFPARRRLRSVACLKCCRNYGNGSFDLRFKLVRVDTSPEAK